MVARACDWLGAKEGILGAEYKSQVAFPGLGKRILNSAVNRDQRGRDFWLVRWEAALAQE
jgi:hypothetical protein